LAGARSQFAAALVNLIGSSVSRRRTGMMLLVTIMPVATACMPTPREPETAAPGSVTPIPPASPSAAEVPPAPGETPRPPGAAAADVIRTRIARRTANQSRIRVVSTPTPPAPVELNDDGTAESAELGLMWSRQVDGAFEQADAASFCEVLELAGYEDWRLPTIDELEDILHSEFAPAGRGTFQALWSATPHELRGTQTFDLWEWSRSRLDAGMAHALCVRDR
jgi:hypothetical protein